MSKKWEKVETVLLHLMQTSILFQRINKAVEEKIGLSIVQFYLLRTLKDHPGISSLELAQITRLHPSTLTQTLRRLVRKRFVFIDKDPRDHRRKILTATRHGRNSVLQFRLRFLHFLDKNPEMKASVLKGKIHPESDMTMGSSNMEPIVPLTPKPLVLKVAFNIFPGDF